ncbi:EfeM/EfeO family lipoprotein [Kutzneria sp. 744]|uniref:EfeM/EfeO family lipoprotein n=1 Tax=Kutzneria sp. (strain 744) TaxID=345341 RepID=UPI0003EEC891|nr:EfeM/EfeO family lipoprotein [Kutzneria sp. 744]EWM11877.1 iron permease FTR1 [Kutzneria sp. 744]
MTRSDLVRTPRPLPAAIALVGVGAVVAVAVWRPWEGSADAVGGPAQITVSRSACGQGWNDAKAGRQTFTVHNTGDAAAEVDLVELDSGKVYGEVEGLGPNTSASMDVQLGAGQFAFRCLIEDTDPLTGPAVRLQGDAEGGAAVVPVTKNDMLPLVKQYEAAVSAGVADLVAKTDKLRDDIGAGNLDTARADWLPAHLAYNSLGAAYGAFGDFADKIDGSDAGFHPLEKGLWHNASAADLKPIADQLSTDVHGLQADLPNEQVDPNDLGLRAHEIMENALQFELTGENDQGSGTVLNTALANLDGSAKVLAILDPVLKPRYADLPAVQKWSDRTRTLLTAHLNTPVGQLDRTTREQINGAVGELLEKLAPVAAICEVRRSS